MKKDLQLNLGKRLLAYSAAASAVFALGYTANAQIIYTDVDPDQTISNGSYNLDLNDDSNVDFLITQGSWYSGYRTVRIFPQGSAGFMSTKYPPYSGWATYTWAQCLNLSATIQAGGAWNSSQGNQTMSLGFASSGGPGAGPWKGQTEKFLGLRFTTDGGTNFHYAWARLSVVSNFSQFTIHDYAYNSVENELILAGDEGEPIPPPTISDITIEEITYNSAELNFTPDVDGTAYFVVVEESEDPPTAEEVVAGEGSGGSTPVDYGDKTVIGGDPDMMEIDQLVEETDYTAYMVLDDGLVETLSEVYDVDFTTLANGLSETGTKIAVYPNPSNGVFNVNADNVGYTVTDVTGKIILSSELKDKVIDLTNFGAGVYYIHLSDGKDIETHKVVVK